MIHTFFTLAELAELAGRDASDAGEFFTELIEDPHSLFTPYVIMDGVPVPVSREELAGDYYWNQDDVRVTEDDADDYIYMAAMVAAAATADDSTLPDKCSLEDTAVRDRIASTMAAWLADPTTGLGEDIDQDIDDYFTNLNHTEGENPKC